MPFQKWKYGATSSEEITDRDEEFLFQNSFKVTNVLKKLFEKNAQTHHFGGIANLLVAFTLGNSQLWILKQLKSVVFLELEAAELDQRWICGLQVDLDFGDWFKI